MPSKKTKSAPPKKRIRPPPPRLSLDTFLKEIHAGRYRSWRGARRAVGRAVDWTPEEREIGFREIDRKWSDAPPRVQEVSAAKNIRPIASGAALTTPGSTLGRHLGQAVSTGDLAYLMWVVEQLGKQVDDLARAADKDPSYLPDLESARRQWRAATTVAFGKIDLETTGKAKK